MDDICLIWSNEHRAWWRSGSNGYTVDIRLAGTYGRQRAVEICEQATIDWTKAPNEVAVRYDDLPIEAKTMLGVSLGIA